MTLSLDQLATLSTEQALLTGGDARLALNQKTRVNKYGCGSQPDAQLVAFGSSTGSTISERGFRASQALHQQLIKQDKSTSESVTYRYQLERVRTEFNQLCGLEKHDNIATIFAASGTDLHLICAQLMANSSEKPLRIIMMDACETGSGVAPAVRGQHFSDHAALGGVVTAFELLTQAHAVEVSSIRLRSENGCKRALADIDKEVDGLIQQAQKQKQRVLLIMIDLSKTGLIAPSPAYIASLRQQYPEQVDILVDACQFRLSTSTLKAYLTLGCMIALTGSKFLTGPVFSGMLLIPPNLSARLSNQKLPASMADYSAQAEWPEHWKATESLLNVCNWGLLLRLEAALAEFRAFCAIPESQIRAFLLQFSTAIRNEIQHSPYLALMAEDQLDRTPITSGGSWDEIPTIFPFILQHHSHHPITRDQTQQIYQQLQFPVMGASDTSATSDTSDTSDTSAPFSVDIANMRCQLGQPVLCGRQDGIDVSALRLCASSRIIWDACANGTESSQFIIQQAIKVLAKTTFLIQSLSQVSEPVS